MKVNTFKKSVFSLLCTVFAFGVASAQDNDSTAVEPVAETLMATKPAETVKKGSDAQQAARTISNQMKEHLALNDAQNNKVYIINLDFLKKTFDNNKNADKAERNKKQRVLEEGRDAKLKSVLTDKQFKVFIANRGIDRKRIIPYYE